MSSGREAEMAALFHTYRSSAIDDQDSLGQYDELHGK